MLAIKTHSGRIGTWAPAVPHLRCRNPERRCRDGAFVRSKSAGARDPAWHDDTGSCPEEEFALQGSVPSGLYGLCARLRLGDQRDKRLLAGVLAGFCDPVHHESDRSFSDRRLLGRPYEGLDHPGHGGPSTLYFGVRQEEKVDHGNSRHGGDCRRPVRDHEPDPAVGFSPERILFPGAYDGTERKEIQP